MKALDALTYTNRYFSLLAFLQGLGGVIFVVFALWLWALLRTDDTLQQHQDRLATKTVIIEKEVTEVTLAAKDVNRPKAEALITAPIQGLSEKGRYGDLPKRRTKDKLSPFDAYKKPFQGEASLARVALVFVDMGLSRNEMNAVLDNFPANITLSFSPYAKNLDTQVSNARMSGIEPWIQIPLQTENFENADMGSQAILRNVSIEQNMTRLDWILSQSVGYPGVIFPPNHIFLDDPTAIQKLLDQIIGRGLGIAEMGEKGSGDINLMAMDSNGHYGTGAAIIGKVQDSMAINNALQKLELVALRDGGAIGYVYPTSLSLTLLKKWMADLEDKGLQLAPLSAVLP